AAPLALHDGCRMLHAEEHTAEQDADGFVEAGNGDLLDPALDTPKAGVIEQAIESAKSLDGRVDGRADLGFLTDIRMNIAGACTKLLREPLSTIVLDVGNDYAAAFFDEQARRALANTARSTSDQGDFAAEPGHALPPSNREDIRDYSGRPPAIVQVRSESPGSANVVRRRPGDGLRQQDGVMRPPARASQRGSERDRGHVGFLVRATEQRDRGQVHDSQQQAAMIRPCPDRRDAQRDARSGRTPIWAIRSPQTS